MPRLVLFSIDLLAVSLLVFGLYFPRHRRRDLVVAYLGVNVGVLAVAGSLSSSTVGAGLGRFPGHSDADFSGLTDAIRCAKPKFSSDH